MARSVQIGVTFDSFNFVTDLSLDPVVEWFDGVLQRNAASRARDEGDKPVLSFRIVCPWCAAPLPFLTTMDLEDGTHSRASRRCSTTIPQEV